ncbi:MAG TPA: hypothetical protein VHL31_08890 [Geminicoccus sp.]|uniref:hypothetical protein n=1 Tax=Geminicoccus sp. TaxID=2024832 RepID=UPI002E333EF5|nr:hypothetical protein [Geminicoccus sp.]HEX2526403.1 hypothetical protein [Geminicoccus sp.]
MTRTRLLPLVLVATVGLGVAAPVSAQSDGRSRPGPVDPRPEPAPPYVDPGQVAPPPSSAFPDDFAPVPDRWRLLETLGKPENLFDPYNQNTLKGDKPIFGDDWFLVLTGISDTVIEPRSIPTPVGIQSSNESGENDVFGGVDQFLFSQTLIGSAALIKGNTAFKPQDLEFRLTLAYNYNYAEADELRVLYADPANGDTRSDEHLGVQEAFLDYHLRNVSERYDFDSMRVGIQPFISDFRGFLFQDNQLGVRFFGNRNNNLFQYNFGWFRRIEKEINSGLNDLSEDIRDDDIFLANLYAQDFPVLGFTSQGIIAYNRNRDDPLVDTNGFPARPAELGFAEEREYDVTYLGLNGDGHFGRFNLTTSAYLALGENRNAPLSDLESDVAAFMLAAEPSIDFDWIRLRGSLFYASGDDDPYDDKETGFDAIFENPQFAGADTSYWIRQSIPLIGGGFVGLSGRNGLLPSLRPSKEQGQSNFTNPGLTLAGVGADFDITPELRVSSNVNYLRFNDTSSLEALRQQGEIDEEIGWDVSAAAIWRPFLNQNVVLRLSGAMLFAGDGFKQLYGAQDDEDVFYSVLANVVLTY